MNDISMPDRNTPIFNQLMAERGYDPKFPKHYMRAGLPYSMDLPKPAQEASRGFMAPGAWIAKRVPTMTPEKSEPELKVNFHPFEVEEKHGSVQQFVQERVAEFDRKHPKSFNIRLSHIEEMDGTITLIVKGTEMDGIDFAPKTDWSGVTTDQAVKEIQTWVEAAKGESFTVRGLSETMPPVFRTEPKTEKIPEDLATRQLELYKAGIVASGTIATSEQTDDSVNAASTDEPRPQTAVIPRPLWISDEEIADEE